MHRWKGVLRCIAGAACVAAFFALALRWGPKDDPAPGTVHLSRGSGFYDEGFDLAMEADGGEIRYTLDSTQPDGDSLLYTGPIHIEDVSGTDNLYSARTDVALDLNVELLESLGKKAKYGFKLPKGMHREFADVVQSMSEKQGEVPPEQIMDAFRAEYLYKNEPLHFRKLQVTDMSSDTKTNFDTKVRVVFTDHGAMEQVEAVGNGPLDAVLRGLQLKYGFNIRILDYEEHALKSGSDSQAAAYIHLMDAESGRITYGVGVSSNITRASVRAIFSAMNRLQLGERRQGISDSF